MRKRDCEERVNSKKRTISFTNRRRPMTKEKDDIEHGRMRKSEDKEDKKVEGEQKGQRSQKHDE